MRSVLTFVAMGHAASGSAPRPCQDNRIAQVSRREAAVDFEVKRYYTSRVSVISTFHFNFVVFNGLKLALKICLCQVQVNCKPVLDQV